MAKKIDLSKTVFELTREYPELIQIMEDLGFTEITKKAMLHSVGKLTTIPKGAKLKNIPMTNIITALISNGFEPEGSLPEFSLEKDIHSPSTFSQGVSASDSLCDARTTQLKSYLRRLGDGEALEQVRADFVKQFKDVDPAEIMNAEQELIKEGLPIPEVQKLCDVHSALFHGATTEERIENAEKAVEASITRKQIEEELAKSQAFPKRDYTDKNTRAAALEKIPGHPLYTFTRENQALTTLLEQFRTTKADTLFDAIRELSIHYAKKGDLLYPNLKVRYGISGPSDVMWTVDDEIRDELGALARESVRNEAWNQRLDAVLKRAEEMIYKEQNILFPIAAVNFTEEEWFGIYQDSKDYAVCFGVPQEIWKAAETHSPEQHLPAKGEIVLSGGHMTPEQLSALLNTIPMEITFIDAENINRFFNETDGPKVFKRPGMAIDREVFSCHPPKIEPMVRSIIDDFRHNRKDSFPIWMEKNGRTMLVTYMAVRDKSGRYLGTMELVQDMEFAKEHFLR